ncbi:kynureninase, putative, partial [Perkinsus marinus ATCC 50983]
RIRPTDGCVEVVDVGIALDRLARHFNVDGYDELLKVLDENDPLKHLRDEFVFPQHIRDDAGQKSDDVIYFLGNSLGLMPRRSKEIVNRELDKWGSMAIEGHFSGDLPWMTMDR